MLKTHEFHSASVDVISLKLMPLFCSCQILHEAAFHFPVKYRHTQLLKMNEMGSNTVFASPKPPEQNAFFNPDDGNGNVCVKTWDFPPESNQIQDESFCEDERGGGSQRPLTTFCSRTYTSNKVSHFVLSTEPSKRRNSYFYSQSELLTSSKKLS